MTKRFSKLAKEIAQLVETEDAFGLKPSANPLAFNTRWKFLTVPQKIGAFRKWIEERVEAGILESTKDPPWTDEYIESAYLKGVNRGFVDSRPDLERGSPAAEIARKEFLASSFRSGQRTQTLQRIATRAYEQLRDITTDMAGKLSRTLTESLVNGYGARKAAQKLRETVGGITRARALTLARTEIVHAQAEGQLDSYEANEKLVEVLAEWLTAGDERVCPLCAALETIVMTVKEARDLLPRHPNCRCAWIPADVGEDAPQKREKSAIEKAITKSVKAETGADTGDAAREKSRWAGADVNPRTKPKS